MIMDLEDYGHQLLEVDESEGSELRRLSDLKPMLDPANLTARFEVAASRRQLLARVRFASGDWSR